MYTLIKKRQKKKRLFLKEQKTFILFEKTNLKTSTIYNYQLKLRRGKLYYAPLYLFSSKQSSGSSKVIILYANIKDFEKDILENTFKINCIGLSMGHKWYPIKYWRNNQLVNTKDKVLALLINCYSNKRNLSSENDERKDLNLLI